jgi:hypothetical protein
MDKELEFIGEFEYKGIWWLPDNPGEQISGTLRFSPNKGVTLDLDGAFNSRKNLEEMQNFPIILGITVEGREITLTNCIGARGTKTSKFYADLVFKNVHFQRIEDVRFKSISVRYSHLDDWLGISNFSITPDNDEIVIKCKFQKPIQFNIGDYKIFIVIETTYPIPVIVQKEVTIKQVVYITVESQDEKSFDEFLNIMRNIKNFLSLGVGEPVYPLAIKGTTESNKQVIKDRFFYKPVEVFYRLSDIPRIREVFSFQMLFTFKNVQDRFGIFLGNWFEKAQLLKPTYDLYFGTLYNPHLYLESQFLSLTQAIESYHQRVYGGKYVSKEAYEIVYDILVNAISEEIEDSPEDKLEDLKGRLKKYLEHGNDFNLRTRLKEVVNDYEALTTLFINDKDKFIHNVTETRNYLTHYDKDKKPPSPVENYEELFQLIQNLKIIVEICLLKEAGFSLEEIKDLFSRNNYVMKNLHQVTTFHSI